MRTDRVLFLLLLLAVPPAAATDNVVKNADSAPTKVVPNSARRRYRLGDVDRPRHGGFIARIENCLPVALLIFLGFRGNVQVSGDIGNVRVSAGSARHDAGR